MVWGILTANESLCQALWFKSKNACTLKHLNFLLSYFTIKDSTQTEETGR